MTRRPGAALRVVALVLVAVSLGGCTVTEPGSGIAGASAPDPGSRLLGADAQLKQALDEDADAVNSYWSEANLADASRTEFYDPSPGGVAPEPGTELIVQPTAGNTSQVDPAAIGDDGAGAPYPLPGLAASTIGKLFFTQGGENYVCSASVAASTTGSVLATASHCLFDVDTGTYNAQFLFVPGYDNGAAPFGRWTLNTLVVPTEYTSAPNWPAASQSGGDTAFARIDPQGGRTAQQVLGAQGIAFGVVPDSILAVGYPAATSSFAEFDGQTARFCAEPSFTTPYPMNYTIDCLMTGGCSGGPWMTRFDPALGAGYLIGVSSSGSPTVPKLNGAYFGQLAQDAYLAADQ